MNLEKLIQEDYRKIYTSHCEEILKCCCELFQEYPELQEINLSGELKIKNTLFTLSSSVVERSNRFQGHQGAPDVYYYALTENARGEIKKIQTIIQDQKDLFLAFTLLKSNPHYRLITAKAEREYCRIEKGKNFHASISGVMGKEFLAYYAAKDEKLALENAIPLSNALSRFTNVTSGMSGTNNMSGVSDSQSSSNEMVTSATQKPVLKI